MAIISALYWMYGQDTPSFLPFCLEVEESGVLMKGSGGSNIVHQTLALQFFYTFIANTYSRIVMYDHI